nr:hypothetical protein [Tanacetum cinerariifolium]
MIIVGADIRPLMLEKSLYDPWKSHMEFYMENKENGRMILDSVKIGPLVWPTITEDDGTTRKKTYAELSASQKLQADCDGKATNIVLQGLPPDVYAIVNHYKVTKEIWDRGDTLYRCYWRFSQLINNMNVINMSMRPVQVNTKFLNSLPPEWSERKNKKRTKSKQNRTKTGSVEKPDNVEGQSQSRKQKKEKKYKFKGPKMQILELYQLKTKTRAVSVIYSKFNYKGLNCQRNSISPGTPYLQELHISRNE